MYWQYCQACSTFLLKKDRKVVFGKNYDWDLEDGLLIVNKRGVLKQAINYSNPVKWKSKYGSVTFNQYGKEFPSGGINETGLVIETMWLGESEYPPSDSRVEIDNMQWVQYQLDNFSTVEEVIESDVFLRVSPLSQANVHYLAGDRNGVCASIEFLSGKRVYHTGKTMPIKALTNDTYAASLKYTKNYKEFGGTNPLPENKRSISRFTRIAYMQQSFEKNRPVDIIEYGFRILSNVAAGEYTKWSIVYDLAKRHIYFHTHSKKKIKKIDLSLFDFSCTMPVIILDINASYQKNLEKKFMNFSKSINKTLIKNTFENTDFLANIPRELLERVFFYSESFDCR
jgi:choloylglycine hydrolase